MQGGQDHKTRGRADVVYMVTYIQWDNIGGGELKHSLSCKVVKPKITSFIYHVLLKGYENIHIL